MSDKKNIFSEEIELSEIVLSKTNQAFERIKQEDIDYMERKNNRGKKSFRTQAAAIAGVCILAASSISVVAAIHHYWGRGMNGNLQASDSRQQELTDSGVAKVYREDPDYSAIVVTDNGITIAPDTVIVDERFAYMTFCISGFSVGEREEPGFEMVNVYIGDNPEDESSWVNMSGSMYDGIMPDENGTPVYEDGAALAFYEDRSLISYYTDSDGNMGYIIQARIADENDSLLGKTIHVNFKNLGTLSKTDFTSVSDGNWDFEMKLPDVSSEKNIEIKKEVEGTNFVMEDIHISPISMQVNYSVSDAPKGNEDDLCIPQVQGVVLKDGTRIPYLSNGGGTGYTDETRTNAYHMAGFDRVIDVDQIEAFIVQAAFGKEMIEIPISE